MIRFFFLFYAYLQATIASGPSPEKLFFIALDEIEERSTAIGIAESEAEAYVQTNRPNDFFLFPTVSARVGRDYSAMGGSLLFSDRAEATANWNLFRFGADATANRATDYRAEGLKAAVLDKVLEVEQQGIDALMRQSEILQKMAISSERLKSLRNLEKVAKERYRKGTISLQDVGKVEIDRSNQQGTIENLARSRVQNQARLEVLLGDGGFPFVWPLSAFFNGLQEKRISDTPFFPAQHPSYVNRKKNVLASEEELAYAWRVHMPRLDAKAAVGYYQGSTLSPGLGWSAGLFLTIPLFEQFAHVGDYKAALQRKASASYQFESALRDLLAEFERAKNDLIYTLRAHKERSELVGRARKLHQTDLRRFRQGRMSVNDLFLNENRLYSLEFFVIETHAKVHQSFGRFCHSLGLKIKKCLKQFQ